ncbi:transmembrane and immunoglobulin domain-containing protein 2 [Macrotis lagotis]|uniref:transmembrane and immunoglobulin domain-containing protein 2 n=1 Tax=Macrotis lagotis TaxID=92651 RepID=UPI003D68A01C
MRHPLMNLFLLMLLGGLPEGINFMVQQEPQVQEVTSGSKVNLTCYVNWNEREQFRVEWKKDNKSLYQSAPISWNSSKVTQWSRGSLDWEPENTIILQLDDVNVNDSGHYVCVVTVEIPEYKKAEGNGTHLIVSDSFKDNRIKEFPENHFYGNILYYQKTNGIVPDKNKDLACTPVKERGESIYSATFPSPPPHRA